ncbi:hypothetical protein GCM10027057_19210 [Marisediminicola antarctica]
MALRIEDYALIGDCHTAALVGTDGSIDWLCLPRFDSASVFGSLLGTEDHGRWQVAPSADVRESTRSYIDGTFTLVTRWTTPTGEAEVIDLMPFGDGYADIIRRVRGISGTVEFLEELVIRFDYGEAIPDLVPVASAPSPTDARLGAHRLDRALVVGMVRAGNGSALTRSRDAGASLAPRPARVDPRRDRWNRRGRHDEPA